MTSLPAYDPNDFASGIDRTTWTGLITDPLKPMTNRLIQGTYSPGSTFKIVTAIAALGERLITPDIKVTAPAAARSTGATSSVTRRPDMAPSTCAMRIEQSCNVYFYTLGEKLKIDTIHEYAKKLGLVGTTGIDLPGERSRVSSARRRGTQRDAGAAVVLRARPFRWRSARGRFPSRRSRSRR